MSPAQCSEGNSDAHEAALRHVDYWQPANWVREQRLFIQLFKVSVYRL